MSGRTFNKVTVRKESGDKEFFDAAELEDTCIPASNNKITDQSTHGLIPGIRDCSNQLFSIQAFIY